MYLWKTTLHLRTQGLNLLVTDSDGDVLKARLPAKPCSRGALLTLCEGLALWKGSALFAALCVAEDADPSLAEALFGDHGWPEENALVHFSLLEETPPPRPRMKRIRGVGDFRKTYLLDARRQS